MIKLKIRSFDYSDDKVISYKESELLDSLVKRALSENDLENKEKYFQVLLNGHNIDQEFWPTIQIKETDSILIAPKIKEGSFGEFVKLAAVIAVTIYTGGAASAAGFGSFAAGMIAAGASIATSLALNAIFPPPQVDLGVLSGGDVSSSQMYSIASQSNTTKKYGTVPKVYGVHRIYPPIAANPYTELETDISSGELVQFYYCVYDLGLGPMYVEDIRIGDTSLLEFADMEYSLVDFNKPAIDEGDWDSNLKTKFTHYKGDVEFDNAVVTLDENQISGGPLSGYQAIRNSAVNSDNVSQEISLTFINPQGLIAYGTNGDTFTRTIELDIEFSKINENNWKNYNDLDFVENFKGVGGSDSTVDKALTIPAYSVSSGVYVKLFNIPETIKSRTGYWRGQYNNTKTFSGESWGIAKGSTYITALTGEIPLNRYVFWNGVNLGKVTSITSSPITGYSRYYLSAPISQDLPLFNVGVEKTYYGNSLTNTTYTLEGITTNKLFRKAEGKFLIARKENGQVYSTVKFTPKETGQFKVRVTRIQSYSSGNYTVQDSLTWATIRTRLDRTPIITDKRHTFLELKIRATNQLNGSIQNLSAICTSVLDTWDGSQWVKAPTNNPAWIFADLLTGEINKRAIPKDRLHIDSLLEWADYCDEIPTAPAGQDFILPRFTSNFVLDFETTLQEILNQVSTSCQASLNIIDGKYGVLIDKKRTIPVQVFTPRNSSGFSSTKNYTVRPDALKVKYVDPSSSWEINEKIVYDDGKNELNALTFEEISTFGCTDPSQAWRFGRYMIAQNKLRQETITINVDFEYLVCTRGDYVQITQDVMKVGGTPARVKTVVGNIITIDEGIETIAVPYGYVARGTNGIVTNTLTVINSDTFQLNGTIPAVGDLIVIGEVGSIVFDCIVKAISPTDELNATLTLVEKADAVYDAESSDSIPDYTPYISSTANADFAPPKEVENLQVTENSWICGANSFEHYIHLDWDNPVGSAYEFFEIYVDDGRGYNIVGNTRDSEYIYYVDSERVGFEHNFKILAVSATGKKLDLAAISSVAATPALKTSNPLNVDSLSTNVTNEILQLDWEPVNDCIREYLVRYSPSLTATWESSIPLLRTDKNTTSAATQARTGTYFIKAVDFNDNESAKATIAITTIPELFNLNVIDTTSDYPTWIGSKDKVVKIGTTLVLKEKVAGNTITNEYWPVGYYYYKNFLDLGDIYTVRLQSLIQAEGYTLDDLMSNWVTLSSLSAMSNSRYSDWDVQAEYRTTESFNVMADWVTLTSINPISEGSQDNWSEWRRFIMGDGTGRIFQFRLKLISNKASVSPRVFDGTIKADMPDRVESYNNLSATSSGYVVTYSPAFKGPGTTPNVQITLENGESGDYWEFTNKTLDGFEIIFYDKTDTAVSRTFDASIKGYGRKNATII